MPFSSVNSTTSEKYRRVFFLKLLCRSSLIRWWFFRKMDINLLVFRFLITVQQSFGCDCFFLNLFLLDGNCQRVSKSELYGGYCFFYCLMNFHIIFYMIINQK